MPLLAMGVEELIEQLKTIPDWRRYRRGGCPLWLMLLMSLLAVMSGYTSLRGWEDFMQRHQQEVSDLFGIEPTSLPRYNTLRRMTQRVEAHQVAQVFEIWSQQNQPETARAAEATETDGIAIDGKSLASTVQASQQSQQDFVTVVSACVHAQSWVMAQTHFQRQQGNEIASVQELLARLDVQGKWFTLDALHAQKKRSRQLSSVATITVLRCRETSLRFCDRLSTRLTPRLLPVLTTIGIRLMDAS